MLQRPKTININLASQSHMESEVFLFYETAIGLHIPSAEPS